MGFGGKVFLGCDAAVVEETPEEVRRVGICVS